MAFLLGSEYCIQSLSNDVSDVQSCIKDIILKIGKINSISWKFPDKFACDLNIDEYLTNYKYDNNDIENNQVSHIVLLELIIDRVCLLLQLHCESVEKIMSKESYNSQSKKDLPNTKMISPCLGLTSKKHWNKLCQLTIYLDNINKELLQLKKANKDLLQEIENLKIPKGNSPIPDNEVLVKDNVSKQASEWLKSLESDNKNNVINRKAILGNISKDVTFKSSQTIDTAFKPCESCHISQTCLREASSLLMRILKDESQSSSLTKLQQELVTIDWLSDKKILQIKDSFSKDLDKSCKHFRMIRQKEIKTNGDLIECQKLCVQLKEMIEKQKCDILATESKFSKEKENLESQIKDYVVQIKDLKSHLCAKTEEYNATLTENKKEIVQLSNELAEHKQYTRKLDEIQTTISNFNVDAADPLEALSLLKEKISNQNKTITQLHSTIEHQKSVNENLTAEESVVKEKEGKLVKRLQNLTQQKHKLEERLDILQDQLESNQESLRVIENQKVAMTMKLSDQDTLIATISKAKDEFNMRIVELEEQVQIMERTMIGVKEEKKLLLNYPDLNGPVEKFDSGNIDQDIRHQIDANIARIKLLSDQNLDLEHALEKLGQMSVSKLNSVPHPSHTPIQSETNSENLPPKSQPNLETSRPVSKISIHSSSASRRTPHRQPATNRPHSRENVTAQNPIIQWSVSNHKPSINHSNVCETCGRQYPQKSDLDVHKEYCAGRRRKIDQK